jgi:molybdopterin synthase catalytic subunit
MFEIVTEPITADRVNQAVEDAAAGAICTFLGVVRDHNLGRQVDYLEYEAYPEMAVPAMQRIADEIRERWDIHKIAIIHRIGRLEIGEASVGIAVSSAHRAEAFAACHYAIDRLKTTVPIWKKEVWADGEEWIEGTAIGDVASPWPTQAGG